MAARFPTFALAVLFLLAISSIAESRKLFVPKKSSDSGADDVTVCESIYEAQDDDTCESIADRYGLTTDKFLSVNPNLDCDQIFPGEWLCLEGF